MSQSTTRDMAQQAFSDADVAKQVFDGAEHTQVREAILRDLLTSESSATLPFQLTRHPYRPGISTDLQRRFDPAEWREMPKERLAQLMNA